MSRPSGTPGGSAACQPWLEKTFFASQADFKYAGDLLGFSDEQSSKFLEEKMEQAGGGLGAQTMADTFNSLRSNDLIWNYVVDNYYIGKQPPPFDLLYWNADQTRMPKALHLFYLRKFYRDNALTEGKLSLMGENLSLKDVTIPIFMRSSKEDHIALLILAGLILCFPTNRSLGAAGMGRDDKPTPEQLEFVRTKVIPILESRCYECHGSQETVEAELRVNSRKALLEGGESGAAIEPGEPDRSLIIQAVRYESFPDAASQQDA